MAKRASISTSVNALHSPRYFFLLFYLHGCMHYVCCLVRSLPRMHYGVLKRALLPADGAKVTGSNGSTCPGLVQSVGGPEAIMGANLYDVLPCATTCNVTVKNQPIRHAPPARLEITLRIARIIGARLRVTSRREPRHRIGIGDATRVDRIEVEVATAHGKERIGRPHASVKSGEVPQRQLEAPQPPRPRLVRSG